VPLLAARLADVGVGHPYPPVTLGLEQHRLDPNAVLLLDLAAFRRFPAAVSDASHEVISEQLELFEREQARPGSGCAGADLRRAAGPGGGEQARQLGLEALDLDTQRAARRTFVGPSALGHPDAGLAMWDCGLHSSASDWGAWV